MRINNGVYKGLDAVSIENDTLKLVVLPQLGAKIASLIYKPQNFEVFFQPSDGIFRLSMYGAKFAEYDTAGADEMYPTIDACTYPYDGYAGTQLPDHGDLWSASWDVTSLDGETLLCQVKGRSLPYEFKRTIALDSNNVHLEYQVKNIGGRPLYGIWVFHGLVACDEHTQIILPETDRVITVHDSAVLGPAGTKHTFPVSVGQDGSNCCIDRISSKSANKTEKIYVDGTVKQGQAALTLNSGKLLYKLLFPADKVPYLGVWINEGGFKGEYNCALEPATGYYDSLEVTHRLGALQPIAPAETLEWYLTINLEAQA